MPVGPFERHLREAIILNRERAPRYAALSGGSSWPVSRRLIAAEILLLPVARWFDWRAGRYHRAGVTLLEPLFESMAQAPAFGSLTSVGNLTMPAVRLRPASMRRRVWQAYRSGGFPFAATALERELAGLDANTMRNSLVRHLLESSHRLATPAPDRSAPRAGPGCSNQPAPRS